MFDRIKDVIVTSGGPDVRWHLPGAGWYLIGQSSADAIDPPITAVYAVSYEEAETAWIEKHGHTIALDEGDLQDYRIGDQLFGVWEGTDDHGNYIVIDTSGIDGVGPIDLKLSDSEKAALRGANGYVADNGGPWRATIRPYNYRPATRTLMSLERKGLVEIERGSGKQPINNVFITDFGVAVTEQLGRVLDKHGEMP